MEAGEAVRELRGGGSHTAAREESGVGVHKREKLKTKVRQQASGYKPKHYAEVPAGGSNSINASKR